MQLSDSYDLDYLDISLKILDEMNVAYSGDVRRAIARRRELVHAVNTTTMLSLPAFVEMCMKATGQKEWDRLTEYDRTMRMFSLLEWLRAFHEAYLAAGFLKPGPAVGDSE